MAWDVQCAPGMRSLVVAFLLAGCGGADAGGDLAGCPGGKCDAAANPSADGGTDGDTASGRFGVNDVSVLFPLPQSESERARFLWLIPRAGEQGPYFPPDAPSVLPFLNADVPPGFGYPAAMITSLRFDPCFPRLGGPNCQAQLRLVAQPVLTDATSAKMLDDAAAHLFYALDAAEAERVVAQLAAIRDSSPVSTKGPLAVHPALAADPAGATAAALRALVVEHCREDNLVRITVNSFVMDNWTFTKFDREGGQLIRRALAGMKTPDSNQGWRRQAQSNDLDDPSGQIAPASADGFDYLLSRDNYEGGAPRDPMAARAAATRINALENPELTDPESADCASCHLATQTRLFASRNGVSFETPTRFVPPSGVDASLVLAPSMQGNLGATIAFGWHTNTHDGGPSVPSISQRTVYESAAIAAYLSAR